MSNMSEQDYFKGFINFAKEKCDTNTASIIQRIDNNDKVAYVISFKYKDFKGYSRTNPMYRPSLLRFLEIANSDMVFKKLSYRIHLKSIDQIEYLKVENDSSRKEEIICQHFIKDFELLKINEEYFVKAEGLFFNTDLDTVYYEKKTDFMKIVGYERGFKGTGSIGANGFVEMFKNKFEFNNGPRVNYFKYNDKIRDAFLFIIIILAISTSVFFACSVMESKGNFSLKSKYENIISDKNNIINDLQLQLKNLTLEHNETISLLNETNVKNTLEKSQLTGVFSAVALCTIMLSALLYNDLKNALKQGGKTEQLRKYTQSPDNLPNWDKLTEANKLTEISDLPKPIKLPGKGNGIIWGKAPTKNKLKFTKKV